jgi:hypothetical protein
MTRILITAIFLVLFIRPSDAYIEVKKRWEIDFEHKPLKFYTYVDPQGTRKNFYYFTYTLTNKSEQETPLFIDICLKIDLHHPTLISKGYKPKVKYYQNTLHPFVEESIIYTEERLWGLSAALRKDRVKELKEKLSYLNHLELRTKQKILAKETILGLAIFDNVSPLAKVFEIMVGGLVDVVKRRLPEEPQSDELSKSHIERDLKEARMNRNPTYEYENRIRSIVYLAEGSEFNLQSQVLTEEIIAPKWLIRNYGPIDEKDSLKNLIDALEDENPLIRWGSYYLLRRLTALSFNYDAETEPSTEANQKAIKLWQEWWYRNKEKLSYNKALNQFVIGDDSKPISVK